MPLIVLATTASGRPLRGRGEEIEEGAPWSWPSTSTASPPKAATPIVSQRDRGGRCLRCGHPVAVGSVDDGDEVVEAAVTGRHSRLQFEPSCISPSPSTTKVRQVAPDILAAMAQPTPIGNPWPADQYWPRRGNLAPFGMAVERGQRCMKVVSSADR